MGLNNPSSSTVNQTTDPVGTFNNDFNLDDFEQYAVGSNPTLDKGLGWGGAAVVEGTNSIVSVTDLAGNAKKRLSLTDAEWIRPMTWGSKWKFIRIGALLTIDHNATFTGGGVCFGICSGTTDGVKGGNPTTNFYGASIQSSNTFPPPCTWTRSAGSDHPWYAGSFFQHARKVTAGSWASISALFSAGEPCAGADGLLAIPIGLEIRRALYTSATYDIAGFLLLPGSNIPERSFTTGDLVNWMKFRDVSNINVFRASAATTIGSISETPGAFNCINFATFEATRAIQLSAIAVQKVM